MVAHLLQLAKVFPFKTLCGMVYMYGRSQIKLTFCDYGNTLLMYFEIVKLTLYSL